MSTPNIKTSKWPQIHLRIAPERWRQITIVAQRRGITDNTNMSRALLYERLDELEAEESTHE